MIIIKKNEAKHSNIGIKVPDTEWQTTGRNVRPPVSNENPAVSVSSQVLVMGTLI